MPVHLTFANVFAFFRDSTVPDPQTPAETGGVVLDFQQLHEGTARAIMVIYYTFIQVNKQAVGLEEYFKIV